MIYSIEAIRRMITPVIQKYRITSVFVFGSYARNDATENSDIDLVVDREGSTIRGLFDMGGLYNDLCEVLNKDVDMVTLQTLDQKMTIEENPGFVKNLKREMVKII